MLAGKTLLVTGVGPGLGGEIARLALRDGGRVMLAARREEMLQAAAERLDPSGERVAWQQTDIGDPDQCAALADAAVDRFGGLDALAQVAAVDAVFGDTNEVTPEDFRKTIDVNLIGSVQMARAAAAPMRERGGGSIVLIGSQSFVKPITPQIAYAASKGALHTAMLFMAKDLGPDRIRVNTVVPTWMWGPMVELYVGVQAQQRGISPDEVKAEIVGDMAIPEIPADEDVAEAVIFLCSDRARFITGQDLYVNSGQVMG